MKKLPALLLSLILICTLTACGSGGDDSGDTGTGKGSVYFLNFKPEADQAWQELAELYTDQTGVEVKVVTAASGEYSTNLNSEMAKSDAPTLFQCGNAAAVADWQDYCLDLNGTKVVDELITDEFNIYDDTGALRAMGYCYEAYGIIVNKTLLAQAGYELSDITNFETLKSVAEDIHARASELGFDAFSSSGLDPSSAWRFSGHLANMPMYYEWTEEGYAAVPAEIKGTYLHCYRNIWDLYIDNSSASKTSLTTFTGDMSGAEFKERKAVFYQNGSWEYAGLLEAGFTPDELAMIPIYCGAPGEENAGLCSGTENCWAVNAKAPQEDIDATLDFLYWLVTSDEGTTMMAENLGEIPFKAAKESNNAFINRAKQDIAEGKYAVTWAFVDTPNPEGWRATLVTALARYSADQTDQNWDAVVKAFVDGWAYEYSVVNG